jgi:hypothetical protein
VDGGTWQTSLYLINGSASAKANYTLLFRGDNGQPILLSLADGRRDNQISGTIAPGGMAVLQTPGKDSDPVSVASATLTIPSGLSGFAVIRERQATGPEREATLSLATPVNKSLVFPFDNTAGFVSSIALAIPCGPSGNISLTAQAADEGGASLGQSTLKVVAGGHLAFLIPDQLPRAKDHRGLIRISASAAQSTNTYLSGVGLRFTSSGGLTTFPPSLSTPPAAVQPRRASQEQALALTHARLPNARKLHP